MKTTSQKLLEMPFCDAEREINKMAEMHGEELREVVVLNLLKTYHAKKAVGA